MTNASIRPLKIWSNKTPDQRSPTDKNWSRNILLGQGKVMDGLENFQSSHYGNIELYILECQMVANCYFMKKDKRVKHFQPIFCKLFKETPSRVT